MSHPRGARPTLRWLDEDAKVKRPPLTDDLGSISHPNLVRLHQHVPQFSRLDRVLSIKDTMVHKFRQGRYRVAAHHHFDTDYAFLCASEIRRDGAPDDVYEYFEGLHAQGRLLPCKDDFNRLVLEEAHRLRRAIVSDAPGWVADAEDHPEQTVRHHLFNGCPVCLFYRNSSDDNELWVAVPVLSDKQVGLTPEVRALLFKEIEKVFQAQMADHVYDWPTRQLKNYEVAYYLLR